MSATRLYHPTWLMATLSVAAVALGILLVIRGGA